MQGGVGGVKRRRKKRGGKKGKRRGGLRRTGPPRRRPKGFCVCPACGTRVAVYTEVPCYVMNCSKCGTTMVKDSSGQKSPRLFQEDIQPE